MFGYMIDTGTLKVLQMVEIMTRGDVLSSLMFHFLDKGLYKFSID